MNFQEASAVQIHLTGSAKRSAKIALYLQGKLSWTEALAFAGPTFQETENTRIEVAIGHSTVNVVVSDKTDAHDDVEYIYPLNTVGRIKITA